MLNPYTRFHNFVFVLSQALSLPPLGATGVFREAKECGFGPTKGSESPLATEGRRRGPFVH